MSNKIYKLKEKNLDCSTFLTEMFEHNKCQYESNELNSRYFVNSFIFKIKTGGNEGGSCWGSSSHSFSVDAEDRSDALSRSICDVITNFLEKANYNMHVIHPIIDDIAKTYYCNSIDTDSDYGDPYGNNIEYDIVSVPLIKLFENILIPQDLEILQDTLKNVSGLYLKELSDKEREKNILRIDAQIASFEKDKERELQDLKYSLQSAKQHVTLLEKKLNTYATNKTQEYDLLCKEKEKLYNPTPIAKVSKLKKK